MELEHERMRAAGDAMKAEEAKFNQFIDPTDGYMVQINSEPIRITR